MKKYILIFLSLIFLFQANAQGCSDAGFCTMGALKPDQEYNKRRVLKLRSVNIGLYRGKSTLSPVIYSAYIDMNASLGEKNTIQIKVPYMYITGKLAKNQGIGDISLAFTRKLYSSKSNWDINGSIGAKIPTNDGNQMVKNEFTTDGKAQPLHAYYQSSLGTYDAIVGISVINRKWLFATGIQIPLTRNKNKFLWKHFKNFPNFEYVKKYQTGNDLSRGMDVMLRIERNFRFSNLNFSVGLLPIYKIQASEKTDPKSKERVKIKATNELALSGLISLGYQFNTKNSISLLGGVRIANKKTNVDGLSRDNVLNLTYSYKF